MKLAVCRNRAMGRLSLAAACLFAGQTAFADIQLEYYGPALTASVDNRTPVAPTTVVRVTIRLDARYLRPNSEFADSSEHPNGQATVKLATVSDGVRHFDYKDRRHRVEIYLATNERNEVVDWQVSAGFVGASTLNTVGGFGNTIVVLGPSRTTSGEGASIRGSKACPSLDLVAGKGVACARGIWTLTRVEPSASSSPSDSCKVKPSRGDVVIYRLPSASGQWTITHSGVVADVVGCRVLAVKSKEEIGGPITTRNPDEHLARYGRWTVYRTNRVMTRCNNNAALCQATDDDPNKLLSNWDPTFKLWRVYGTDTLRIVRVNYWELEEARSRRKDYQCHGFTFGGQERTSVDIEGDEVQAILDDNGYRQIDAEGSDGSNRFYVGFPPL